MHQHILAADRDAELRVYAVWLQPGPALPKTAWDPAILADRRVVHLWDARGVIGRFFGRSPDPLLGSSPSFVWDAWLLFDRDARWAEQPSHLVGFGSTVIGTTYDLRRKLDSLR